MGTRARWGSHALILSLVGAMVAGSAPAAWAATPIQAGSGAAPRLSGVPRAVPAVPADGPSALPSETREVLVAFDLKTTSVAAITNAHRAVHGRPTRMFSMVPGLQLVELPAGSSVDDAVRQYKAMPGVRYAEPNQTYELAGGPNDPLFWRQWGYNNTGQTGGTADADIDALEAWGHTTGSNSVVVAVVDTGVDYNHPDLAANMWVNSDEIPGNGIDDDHNTWIDDVHGIDTANMDGDPLDDNGHGTHVAGTIGAVGNNAVGGTGMSPNVKIMALKAFSAAGTAADVLTAWQYALNNGATIINNSWGGSGSSALRDAVAANPALFVCAAGNGGADYVGDDNDGAEPFYPASYDLPNILSVGATDPDDQPADFSNFGATSVDVFAPGVDILSTYLPEVSGIASDATVNVLTQEQFTTLAAWQHYSVTGRPYEPRWSLQSGAYTSTPSSTGITGYVNNEFTILGSANPANLTTADHPAMRYKVRIDTELDYDFLLAGMLDGAGLHTAGWLTGDSQGSFIEQVVDLADYANTNTYKPFIALMADESNSSAQGYEGVYVDDLEVFDIDPGASGDLWSYDYDNAYTLMNGTSMATPHVTGLAALLLAQDPARDAAAIKAKILGSVDAKSSLTGKCVTGGRVNAHAALNRAPVASDDSYSAFSGVKLTVPAKGVLANDTDADGDSLQAKSPSLPAHGTLVLNIDGSFEYTPTSGYTGTDTFTYKAKDDLGESASAATVTITVDPAPVTPKLTPVYRFFRPSTGTHFYTSDPIEMQRVRDTMASTYTFEGVGYYINASNSANSVPLYRFYNRRTGTHLYTADEGEKSAILANLSGTYSLDGVSYYVSMSTGKQVYRFYSPSKGVHFYSSDQGEIDYVRANLGHIWSFEGPAYKVGQ